jgi:hypothetical protein
MSALSRKETRTMNLPGLLFSYGKHSLKGNLQEYLGHTARLYRAIPAATGSRVIVDSSKFASYGVLLGLVPDIDLYILHIIRDSKAVAYSWNSRKPSPGNTLGTIHPAKSPLLWDIWNQSTEIIGRRYKGKFLRVRFEDFILRPRPILENILSMMGEEIPALSFLSDGAVRLNCTHTINGNSSRFITGEVELNPEERWKCDLNLFSRIRVDGITRPQL